MKELTWPGKTGKRLVVEDKYNWLALDSDGDAYVYVQQPETGWDEWWDMGMAEWKHIGAKVRPPEPGPWYEQIYWIGDD